MRIQRYIATIATVAITTLLVPQSIYAQELSISENVLNNCNSELFSQFDKVADSEEENSKVIMIAHRGMSSLAPENTIAAIEMAGLYGYGGVEFDVQQTKDGKYVISHDLDVKRMTNGSGKINGRTLTQIKKLTIDNGNGIKNYSGLKIPTLEEALACCQKYDLVPCIEIKNVKNVKGILKIIKKYNYLNSALITSSNVSALKAIRKINSDISLSLISSGDGIATVNTAKRLKCDGININYRKLNNEVAAYAKQNNMQIGAWTVNNMSDNYQCQKYGVDYIITNSLTDSNNFENLSEDNSIEFGNNFDDIKINSGKVDQAESIENCIASENTWFKANGINTVNVGKNTAYNYDIMNASIEKGTVITITAQVNSLTGNYPYFTVKNGQDLICKVEDKDKKTGWQTMKLVYTVKKTMQLNILFGMNESESGIFQIKNIQVSNYSRYQPEKVTMNESIIDLAIGDTYNLEENIQVLDNKVILKWKSSKQKIASVSELGLLTAKKVGKTNITVITENGKTSKCTVIVKPKEMSKLVVSNKTSQKVDLKWNKITSISGYEIYSKNLEDESYNLVMKIKKNSKTSATIKNLKPGQKYYFKIRTYITIDGKKYYSDFSKETKVTTKSK